MEPVAMDALACASREALRPSQPTGALPAYPSPINGCDLREVSLPESLRLLASVTAQPSWGKWQLAQLVLPEAEIRGSKNRSRPRSTSAWFSIGRGGGRRYSPLRFVTSALCACAGTVCCEPNKPTASRVVIRARAFPIGISITSALVRTYCA